MAGKIAYVLIKEMIDKASAARGQGNGAHNAGSLNLAISKYITALNVIDSR